MIVAIMRILTLLVSVAQALGAVWYEIHGQYQQATYHLVWALLLWIILENNHVD
jgi:hypothetical protein